MGWLDPAVVWAVRRCEVGLEAAALTVGGPTAGLHLVVLDM